MKIRKITGNGFRAAALGTAVCLAAAGVSGCTEKKEPQVIGERESGSAGENETEALETEAALQDMLELPARYEGVFQAGKLEVKADAQIQVPEVEQIPVVTVKNADFPEELFETVKGVLEREYQAKWIPKDSVFGEQGISLQDETKGFHLDYHVIEEGKEEEQVSFIWGYRTAFDPKGAPPDGELQTARQYSKDAPSVADRAELADAMEEKAGELVEECGLTLYEIRKNIWYQSVYDGGEERWSYRLRLTPRSQGVPLTGEAGRLNGASLDGPYLDLSFFEDGTLNEFQLVERYEVTGMKEELFLLPFGTIQELFEQYVRDIELEWEAYQQENAAGTEALWVPRSLRISRAALEYGMFPAGEAGEPGERLYIPVWSFYGYQEDGEEEVLLLSIRADDGQPAKREWKTDTRPIDPAGEKGFAAAG
ncbi:MAG: hypothetical protein KHY46_14540 [Clostridiales bacterium]|nr:hypothetical protein [Clostridiales bacterium]